MKNAPKPKKKLQLSLDQYVQVYQYNKVYRGLISKGILFQIDQTVLKWLGQKQLDEIKSQ